LNGDVHGWHLLVTERDGGWRLAGLFDFDDAMLGWWEHELAGPALSLMAAQPAVATTTAHAQQVILLIRHAEQGPPPQMALTDAGHRRAAALAHRSRTPASPRSSRPMPSVRGRRRRRSRRLSVWNRSWCRWEMSISSSGG
jgi:hypothetical protein